MNSYVRPIATLLLILAAPLLAAAERPPNIIFIMADDLGYGDLGCYGQKVMKTPNIDRLARQGLRFTQAYAGGPVCTPSRSVLMTGLHNGHTVARDNVPHYHTYLRDDDVTLAEVLQEGGYTCGGVGKWSLGDAGTEGRATNQGFDHWFGYLNQDHAHYYYTEYLDDDEGRLALTGNTAARRDYSHDLLADRALDFIRANKDKPFFFYGAFTLPHFASKKEDPDGLTVPSTEAFDDQPWDTRTKKYATMIHKLDQDVGRIVDLVDELGLSKDTLIIMTSDNGGHHLTPEILDTSGPLRGFKRDIYEGGIRVPFIVRWPGKTPAGETSDEIVTFWDMLPTFAALAGVSAPKGLDGVSVVDALMGGTVKTPHEYLYWDYGHCRERFDQAVRLGDWKGVRLGKESPMALYDLSTDIGEEHDVASQHPDTVAKIAEIMEKAHVPNPRYEVGNLYTGGAIWKKEMKSAP
jgi:arylsulfatase A-like enzyme